MTHEPVPVPVPAKVVQATPLFRRSTNNETTGTMATSARKISAATLIQAHTRRRLSAHVYRGLAEQVLVGGLVVGVVSSGLWGGTREKKRAMHLSRRGSLRFDSAGLPAGECGLSCDSAAGVGLTAQGPAPITFQS